MDALRTPTVFELIACDNLKGGLREAIRYLLENLLQIERVKQLPLPRTDETILLLDLLIEYNYLRSYKASYAENLFQLVRLYDKPATRQRQWLALASMTLVPYLMRKCDKYFEDLNYKEARTAAELKRIRQYRLFSKSCSFIKLIYLLRFAAGKSVNHSVMDGLLGIRLVGRDSIDDENLNESSTTADKISKTIADVLGRSLTIGSYVIQFLDYWNTHSNSAPLFNASLPIPDPPKKAELAYTDEGSSNICLICLHVRQNECALSNTGYVFCYSCIQRYVTTKRRCPVTGLPTKVDNIVKLFTSAPS